MSCSLISVTFIRWVSPESQTECAMNVPSELKAHTPHHPELSAPKVLLCKVAQGWQAYDGVPRVLRTPSPKNLVDNFPTPSKTELFRLANDRARNEERERPPVWVWRGKHSCTRRHTIFSRGNFRHLRTCLPLAVIINGPRRETWQEVKALH